MVENVDWVKLDLLKYLQHPEEWDSWEQIFTDHLLVNI